jgi:hypothetical protein
VLIFFFLPVFDGKNGLDYLDNLYNSISKGSAYYILKVKEDSDKFKGNSVTVNLTMENQKQAEQTALLFQKAGATASISGTQVRAGGDLGKILEHALADADAMYKNDGKAVANRYGYEERRVLYNWWKAMEEMDKSLKKDKKFKEAKVVSLVEKKAVECSYNYYGVQPQGIGDRWGTVVFSLIFYVIYTLWYGFAILFMFEGWGLKLGH